MDINKEVKRQAKRGLWKPEEDLILKNYVETHGEGNWAAVSKKLGLMRGGKSCRLRWKNYLRPNIKRGRMSQEEEDLIIRMHKLIGNRWSLIAGRLPGRTDNEVKNYWNTHLNKKCRLPKRKASDCSKNNTDTTTTTSSNNSKVPRICDSENIKSNSEEGERNDDANMWTDIECECALISPNNAAFLFDDEPFIAYLDSFLTLSPTPCLQANF